MSYIKATFIYSYQDQEMNNVLHFDYDQNSVLDLQIATDAIGVEWANRVSSRTVNTFTFIGINWLNLEFQSTSQFVPFTGGSLVGTAGGDEDASQIALLVSLLGELPQKPSRGRIFFPGVADDQLQNGRFITGAITAYEEFVEALFQVPSGGAVPLELVIYSPTNVANGVGLVANDVASVIGRTNPATQRRRRLGAGG